MAEVEKTADIKLTMMDGSVILGIEYTLPDGRILELYERDPYQMRPDVFPESSVTHIRQRLTEGDIKEISLGDGLWHAFYSLTPVLGGIVPPKRTFNDLSISGEHVAQFIVAKAEFFAHVR